MKTWPLRGLMLAREQGKWHVLGGTEGQSLQVQDYVHSPFWGEVPSPPLICVGTRVQHWFGTNTIHSAKAWDF